MAHVGMSHGIQISKSFDTYTWTDSSSHEAKHLWVMSHVWMSHGSPLNESFHTNEYRSRRRWHLWPKFQTGWHVSKRSPSHLYEFPEKLEKSGDPRMSTAHGGDQTCLDLLIFPVFLETHMSDWDSVHSRVNQFEILGTPEKTCLICTGTPVKTCWKFWQS